MCVRVCVYVCVSVCECVCLSVCLSVCVCGSCTAEVEFEFTSWARVQATTGTSMGGSFRQLLINFFFFLLTCKWVDHDEFWVDWVYCCYGPRDGTRKPLPITVPAVAWSQGQVVNSNSTSSGKEPQVYVCVCVCVVCVYVCRGVSLSLSVCVYV